MTKLYECYKCGNYFKTQDIVELNKINIYQDRIKEYKCLNCFFNQNDELLLKAVRKEKCKKFTKNKDK